MKSLPLASLWSRKTPKIRRDSEEKKIEKMIFIVGSMKCGTTILYDFLCRDPRISGAKGKEVHYFTLHDDKDEDWYRGHFQTTVETEYGLDASPTYFDLTDRMDIPGKIKSRFPNAKIIILIRDPIERIVSHFSHLRKVNKLPEMQKISVEELADTIIDGEAGDNPLIDQIRSFSFYKAKIDKFSAAFGREKVFLIHNDDLRAHGRDVMSELYRFLGLSAIQGQDYSEQKYLNFSSKTTLRQDQTFALSQMYGKDYYLSCRSDNVIKPDLGGRGVAPVGAIIDEVLVGKDGWLFLVGGSNPPAAMYDESTAPEVAKKWHAVVRQRAARCRELGVQYFHLIVPEKLSILSDLSGMNPPSHNSQGDLFSRHAPSDISGNLIRLFDLFRGSAFREKLYFRTDSHWTHLGAFLAYQQFCAILGIAARGDLLSRKAGCNEMALDLGSKLPGQPKERATFVSFVRDAQLIYRNKIMEFKVAHKRENDGGLHVGSHVRFRNETAPVQKRIMVFGDSFAECRPTLLTGLLAETFLETDFIWSTSLDFGLIAERRPDIVLAEMTERFMTRLPNDSFDVLHYAEALVAKLKLS
jgi:hypothetical protein